MPDIFFLIDLVVIIALCILGMIVLLQNSKLALNRIFAVFVACISIWILTNYISNGITNSPDVVLIASYLVFLFSYASAICLLVFTIYLANDKKAKKAIKIFVVPIILIGLLSITPLVVKGVELQDSVYGVIFGPGITVYGFTMLSAIAVSIYIIRKNEKKAVGDQKGRLRVLFLSLVWTLPVLLTAQFVLPTITGWFGLTNLGILSILILVYGLYYGAVRHHLFDLRLATVRALAYLLVLGTVSLIYVIISSTLTTLLVSRSNDVWFTYSLNILLIAFILSIYAPLKRIFDKLTNKLFYRDAYDTQVFLDQFNKILVSSYEPSSLLGRSSELINENLKPTFSVFHINETNNTQARLISSEVREDFADKQLKPLWDIFAHMKQKVIVASLYEIKDATLHKMMIERDIEIAACLSPGRNSESIGYLLLGTKKSGNHYSFQDLKVVEIIANEMVIAIQNSLRFEEIKNFNKTLQERVDEATDELRITNKKLRMIDESKDEFISMASHQLRTPLTSVKGYISMMLEGDIGQITSEQRKVLEEAYGSSQRMVYLISDFLNVSRLQTGKFVLEKSDIYLPLIIADEIDQLRASAQARNITLDYTPPEQFPVLRLDENKIRQVMMNFIDNAIYYSKSDGGVINITLAKHSKHISFKVIDNGIGVPRAEQHRLFSKFYRASNAKKARPDGTGIGIFMAKKVVVAHGGAIIFESTEGKGSTFGFRLPIEITE